MPRKEYRFGARASKRNNMEKQQKKGDSLGDRMKGYEEATKTTLPRRMPVVIRIDGKAFHTYTKGCQRPWDANLIRVMDLTALELCKQLQGVQVAYVQSDEISLLLHNYKRLVSQAWFDNEVQKMVSVSASIASTTFSLNSKLIWESGECKPAYFDSRVFVLPESEVNNYFVWRQQDATRNSVQMLARSLYSHKELMNKNNSELQDLCFAKGQNWNDLPISQRRGRCIVQTPRVMKINGDVVTRNEWVVNNEIPVFSKEKSFIEKFLEVDTTDTSK
jgi:tRNA(His) 5'-end guanylyltransferase